jgi:hypothetical protein
MSMSIRWDLNNANKLHPISVTHDAPIGIEGAPETGSRAAALAAGLGTAFVGAIICAVIVVQARLPYDAPALGLGFAVALVVRKAGGGNTHPFAVVGAFCAFAGCVLAEWFSISGFHANDVQGVTSVLAVAQTMDDPDLVVQWLQTYFRPWSLVFYALAILVSYKLSRRPKW